MILSRHAIGRYRLALSTAILDHKDAVFEALALHDHGCLSNELAEFLLAEAHWDRDEFQADYLAGRLDG